MTHLEKLTQEIREKLPRLMELESGCTFTRKDEFGFTYVNEILQVGGGGQIADTGDYDDAYYDIYSDRNGIETIRDLDNEIEEIIGKELMLNDVLEWLSMKGKTIDSYGFDSAGNFLWFNTKLNKFSTNPSVKWDLSKPYLKDQSPELVEFLFNLIEK